MGRVRALSDCEDEYRHFLAAVQQIARRAAELDLHVALEVLNRYESHLLNTAAQALEFVEAVDRLFLFHAADSNRQAVGRGHTDFLALLRALRCSGYNGDVIVGGDFWLHRATLSL